MPETTLSVQPSARLEKAGPSRLKWRANLDLHLTLAAGGILLGLAVAVGILRFQHLAELPLGLFSDEAAHGVDALRVLQGEHAVFFPEANGREGLIVYTIALLIPFLGRTVLAIRLPTALASVGTVFVVFWLGCLFFGEDEESGQATPWRGLLVGGVGAGLMAVSISQTIIGRTAFRVNFFLLFLSLSFALLWVGWAHRSWWRIALAGVCSGLLPYTYIAARFMPLLLLFFGLSFLLPRSISRENLNLATPFAAAIRQACTRIQLRANLPWIFMFLGVAGLVAAPLLVHFVLHPEHFSVRSSQLFIFHPTRSNGDPLGTFLRNVWDHLLVFGFQGDPNWRHNFNGRPLLNPLEAFFYWLGVGMTVWHWQRPAYRLLLLWLGVLLLPAILALDTAPNTLRMLGAAPAIYLLIGVGIWEMFRWSRTLWQRMVRRKPFLARNRFLLENDSGSLPHHTLQNRKRSVLAIAVGILAGGMVLWQGLITYRIYFQEWATAPEVHRGYKTELTHLARVVNAQPPNTGIIYLVPSGYRDLFLTEEFREYSFEFLYQGMLPVYLFHTAMPNFVQKIKQAAEQTKPVLENIKVVNWNHHWTGDESERFAFLLAKYGRYVSSDVYADFQIHNYTDIALDRPWVLYEHLEPLTVIYDGGLALQGIALGQDAGQLSHGQLVNLGQNRMLWLVLQWQALRVPDADYWISLRLYNAAEEHVYQKDTSIWKSDHTPTGLWAADDISDTPFHLTFPPDLRPGDYELRLVVYNAETLTPTVQVDVWEPEVVLARLHLAEAP